MNNPNNHGMNDSGPGGQGPIRPQKGGKKGDDKKRRRNRFGLLNSVSIILLVLFVISGLYSVIAEQSTTANNISLTDLVHDIGMGKVTTLTVRGDDLAAEYQDKSIKHAKKETDAAVTETFQRYGLTPDKLNAVKITVEGPSGFWFWVGQLAPFLAPLVFLA
jgi:hypothetical protein